MRKYWASFKIGFQVAVAYPVTIFFRVLRHATLVTLFVILWSALLHSQSEVGGFNLSKILTYYILVEIVDILYTQAPARLLGRDIRTGDLNNYLTKPFDYWKNLLAYVLGQQIANSSLSVIVVVCFLIFFPNLVSTPSNPVNLILFFLFTFMAFVLSHQIFFMIGELGFYVSEITHIRQGFNQLMELLGGRWIPLSFFPAMIKNVLNFLPFSFLFNFPIDVFQQLTSSTKILKGLIIELLWLGILLICGNILWKKGVKRYEAYGR